VQSGSMRTFVRGCRILGCVLIERLAEAFSGIPFAVEGC
jgi:hypothetical protein